MPPSSLFFQHGNGNPCQSNQARKGNKWYAKWKGKIIFADNVILYVEKPKYSIKIVGTNGQIQQRCRI